MGLKRYIVFICLDYNKIPFVFKINSKNPTVIPDLTRLAEAYGEAQVGDPDNKRTWIPAFAGMTKREYEIDLAVDKKGKFWYLRVMAKKIPRACLATRRAEIGVFGGSGFYSLFDKAERVKLTTPYGSPSAPITIGEVAGKRVAFIPRHGEKHQLPPHKVPYKANIYAFKMLGVENIISPCAAGSLQPKIKPGHFVILDQFFDRTCGRDDTYYHGPETVHIAGAKPYCPNLQKIAFEACKKLKISVHKNGSVVVINGPRFSTTAESAFFTKLGCGVINMTQYPEVILAREQEICFLGIALITDWDAGIAKGGKIKPVELSEVMKVFAENNEKSKKLIFEIIKRLPHKRDCPCPTALSGAKA